MKKYDDNIDMIITAVGRIGYIDLLIKSIKQYTEYAYKIFVVVDVRNEIEKQFFNKLNTHYVKDDAVSIVISKNKEDDREGFAPCPGDGRMVGKPSFYKSAAYETGIENSCGKYVCLLDYDCVFLNSWTDDILPLTDKYFFVSAMWRGDLDIARDQFFIYQRKKFDDVNLMPDCSIGDTTGNVTHFANNNSLKYYICDNSAVVWGDESLRKYHMLDLPHGEQMFVNGKPFLYHYGRGSAREIQLYEKWQTEVIKYLQ